MFCDICIPLNEAYDNGITHEDNMNVIQSNPVVLKPTTNC